MLERFNYSGGCVICQYDSRTRTRPVRGAAALRTPLPPQVHPRVLGHAGPALVPLPAVRRVVRAVGPCTPWPPSHPEVRGRLGQRRRPRTPKYARENSDFAADDSMYLAKGDDDAEYGAGLGARTRSRAPSPGKPTIEMAAVRQARRDRNTARRDRIAVEGRAVEQLDPES